MLHVLIAFCYTGGTVEHVTQDSLERDQDGSVTWCCMNVIRHGQVTRMTVTVANATPFVTCAPLSL